ncbi:MAG: prepilin-type N-terminal cleavage/methylation domain-containing protein [Opitutaceae bacterium]
MHFSPPRSNRRRPLAAGFTLIEILAVLAVIAAIIAIGVPAIAKVLQSARVRNAEGTANVVRSALVQYLSKPGSSGTLPVTEGASAALTAEYTGGGSPTAAAIAAAATLDNVLLAEGVLDRPISLRLGAQGAAATGAANGFGWQPTSESFGGSAAPTLSYSATSRVECAVSDGLSNPGATGQTAGSAACAFSLTTTGTLIPSGTRVAYLVVKSVPDGDAYQLALDVDGSSQVQNTAAAPAASDQALGPVAYAKDGTGSGFVDVYYYLTSI